jgi:UDP-3-O-[3-hydroxymyristoyl] glucosamine N-acyltransferase
VRKGVWSGIPVQPLDEYKKQNAHIKSIPRLKEEIKKLKKKVKNSE